MTKRLLALIFALMVSCFGCSLKLDPINHPQINIRETGPGSVVYSYGSGVVFCTSQVNDSGITAVLVRPVNDKTTVKCHSLGFSEELGIYYLNCTISVAEKTLEGDTHINHHEMGFPIRPMNLGDRPFFIQGEPIFVSEDVIILQKPYEFE